MFAIGNQVIHPIHGLGTVVSCTEQEILGQRGLFAKINFDEAKLTLDVNASGEGSTVRELIKPDAIAAINAHLKTPCATLSTRTAERLAFNTKKLKSNAVLQIAEVVRDLTALSLDRKITPKEQNLLKQARRALATEIAYLTKRSVQEVDDELDECSRDAYYDNKS